MKITVLNGSPKGDISVTMQYVHFMAKYNPGFQVNIHNISLQIKKIEREDKAFNSIMNDVKTSDLVIWAFPLYVCLVPSQYKRFIELISERKAGKFFRGRYACVLTTSIHFFDNIAHSYMRAICDDLGMNFAGSYSAEMYDLLQSAKRSNFLAFIEALKTTVDERLASPAVYPEIRKQKYVYRPGKTAQKTAQGDKKILIITDQERGDKNLAAMTDRLKSSFSHEPEIVNLHDIEIKGGCIGCIQCGYDNSCSYGESDDYHEFYETKVKTADIIFLAGVMQDRFLSSKWKQFFDRAFYNTHIPVLAGKQIGWIISGPLSNAPFLHEFIDAATEWHRANQAGVITDESGDSKQIDFSISALAKRSVWFAEHRYVKPHTFLGVGGWKIFRDDVYGRLRFPFISDYKYYKEHGLFDFPQNMFKIRMINAVLIFLSKFTGFREEIYRRRMRDEIVKPLVNVVKYK